MSNENNNLTELNNILFETLKGVKDGSIEDKKATSLTNIANSIINNTKTQLQAYKLTKGMAFREEFGKAPKTLKASGDTYDQKHEFAIFKGYENVTEAIGKMGKSDFENEFKEWIK